MPETIGANIPDRKAARRQFSRLGWAIFIVLAAASVLQIAAARAVDRVWPQGNSPDWLFWVITFAPLYLVAVPLGLLLLRRVPAAAPPQRALQPGQCVIAVFVCIFMMYAGNLLGALVLGALQTVLGYTAVNPVLVLTGEGAAWLRVLVLTVLAPLIEEYLFRKQLIDRMRPYGEALAVVVSALLFGLFHGNLSQFFYAFGLGLVFGYLYLQTGRLRYSAALHMLVNFLGSAVGPALLERVDPAALEALDLQDMAALAPVLEQMLPLLLYSLTLIACSLAGLVLLCVSLSRLHFAPAPQALPRGARLKTVFLNPGMLFLIAGCLILFVLSFVP